MFRFALVGLFVLITQLYSAAVPDRLSNEEFWQTITEFSEDGGEFPSENFVSNEQNFQMVLSRLKAEVGSGLAYIGVGPEQNFTYISALQPKIAFIIDIRRQNLVEHLMYKAIFERSANRAEFLATLFSRKPVGDLSENVTAKELFAVYRSARADEGELNNNIRETREHLVGTHGFRLRDSDNAALEYIFQMFALYGAGITYSSRSQNVTAMAMQGNMPDYAALMTATDETGGNQSFLEDEAKFRVVREMQLRNLIVPIVGDFGGNKAIRSVGRYLKEHDLRLGAFYLSNVEQYLFAPDVGILNGGAKNFFSSAATLPLTPSSVFIRSSNRSPGTQMYAGFQSLLSPIAGTIQAFNAGQINSYEDVLAMSR